MAALGATDSDLINFDIIETHKENIQSLPGGRSAKQLASILSPLPSSRSTGANATPTLEETKTLYDAIRQEYEIELQSIADSDDPLDIYDRYVKWTLNAYPSAQATPQSQLLPLLERATKAFLTSSHYKNDPRYLKLWLHYIRFFSDSPRETFAFLARHGIGEGLGLFYEEFAAWLEAAGRWIQADEVYKLGIEREARPTERLARKYSQFQQRFDARPQVDDEPSSPALPTVRPALAAKIDPFASAHRSDDPQAARQRNGLSGSSAPTSRSGKPKMAIFSDADNAQQQLLASNNTKGWDTIGSMKERKKENTIEARSWAGEKLKAGGRVGSVPKMEIFKDPASRAQAQSKPPSTVQNSKQSDQVVNPRTGRAERVFVDLEAIYPPGCDLEFSFEELRAMSRGWAEKDWRPRREATPLKPAAGNAAANATSRITKSREPEDIENLTHSFADKIDLNSGINSNLSVHDVSTQSMVGMPESDFQPSTRPLKQKERKLKIREVKQETQTVKTRLESPTGKKLKRKTSSQEPTMTFHSKAATNEIYDMFNQPLRKPAVAREDTQSGDDTDFTEGEVDDGYSTAGDAESTETGRASAPSSEYGDDTLASIRRNHSQSQSQTENVSPWSDFTTSKHVPHLHSPHLAAIKDKTSSVKNQAKAKHKDRSEDMTENMDSSSQNQTQTSGLEAFDTQAIAAIAGANFDDLDTKAIAMMAGDVDEDAADAGDVDFEQDVTVATATNQGTPAEEEVQQQEVSDNHSIPDDALATPVDNEFPEHREISHKPRFIPIPPLDYEPTPHRPYRDPAMLAQNKMPFMTPIAERTESSLAPSTVFNALGYFDTKTPCKSQYESPSKIGVEDLFLSSPQQQVTTPISASPAAKRKYGDTGATEDELITSSPQKKGLSRKNDLDSFSAPCSNTTDDAFNTLAAPSKPVVRSPLTKVHKGPIIPDLQCNPCDEAVRRQILSSFYPPLSTQKGYDDQSTITFGRYPALKSFADKQAKLKAKSSPRKSQNDKPLSKTVPPVLKFTETTRVYAVKRELGQGAFAPVYLVDSYDPDVREEADENDKENKSPPSSHPAGAARQPLEALKTESPPGTLVWEFHIVRLIKQRLGSASRSMQSIILAHECHLYRDEAYLVLSYSPQGTLLDLVNMARTENVKAGKPAEGLDEVLAMWFSVELLRTLEDLHRVGILHGDLKGDNCLVRFDTALDLTAPFDPEGNYGWQSRGLKLIDFGRGIDTRMFKPNAQFIADWPSCPQDCTEIRECRPWKWQIDYHGAAGVIHSLLFGKYIETVPAGGNALAGPGQKKEWKLKETLKRYWEKDIWGDVFATLLNPGCVADGEEMPIQGNLRRVRTTMEKWLVEEGERGGRDLRANLRRMERLVCGR